MHCSHEATSMSEQDQDIDHLVTIFLGEETNVPDGNVMEGEEDDTSPLRPAVQRGSEMRNEASKNPETEQLVYKGIDDDFEKYSTVESLSDRTSDSCLADPAVAPRSGPSSVGAQSDDIVSGDDINLEILAGEFLQMVCVSKHVISTEPSMFRTDINSQSNSRLVL